MSEAREQLRQAIAKRDAALAQLARINRAISAAPEPYEVADQVDEASEALKQARSVLPDRLLASVLGETIEDIPSVREAEIRLTAAQQRLEDARETRSVLASSADRARSWLDVTTQQVKNAIGGVLRTAHETKALLEQWHEGHRRLAALKATLDVIGPGGLPRDWDAERDWVPAGDIPPVREWRAAIEALHYDASAPLPPVQ